MLIPISIPFLTIREDTIGIGSTTHLRIKEVNMRRMNPKRFALVFGVIFALFYLESVLVVAAPGRGAPFPFLKAVFPVLRADIPVWEIIVGVMGAFLLGWLIGAAVVDLHRYRLLAGSIRQNLRAVEYGKYSGKAGGHGGNHTDHDKHFPNGR